MSIKIKTGLDDYKNSKKQIVKEKNIYEEDSSSGVNFPKYFGAKSNNLNGLGCNTEQINLNTIVPNTLRSDTRTKFVESSSNMTSQESNHLKSSTKGREESQSNVIDSDNFYTSFISNASPTAQRKSTKNPPVSEKPRENSNEKSVIEQLTRLQQQEKLENME
jgi:hypothetical protein